VKENGRSVSFMTSGKRVEFKVGDRVETKVQIGTVTGEVDEVDGLVSVDMDSNLLAEFLPDQLRLEQTSLLPSKSQLYSSILSWDKGLLTGKDRQELVDHLYNNRMMVVHGRVAWLVSTVSDLLTRMANTYPSAPETLLIDRVDKSLEKVKEIISQS